MTFDLDKTKSDKKMFISVSGGMLMQSIDRASEDDAELKCVTKKQPSKEELENLLFGMKVCKHVKSNAILLTKELKTIGVGAGQMNRVGSAEIALEQANKAGADKNLVLASDGFLPFDDTVTLAAKYGVTTIVEPGGSIRDEDCIKKANELGICMLFTGVRHFKH